MKSCMRLSWIILGMGISQLSYGAFVGAGTGPSAPTTGRQTCLPSASVTFEQSNGSPLPTQFEMNEGNQVTLDANGDDVRGETAGLLTKAKLSNCLTADATIDFVSLPIIGKNFPRDGFDYRYTKQVTIPAGETEVEFAVITTYGDKEREPRETFLFSTGGSSSNLTLAPLAVEVSILDDDKDLFEYEIQGGDGSVWLDRGNFVALGATVDSTEFPHDPSANDRNTGDTDVIIVPGQQGVSQPASVNCIQGCILDPSSPFFCGGLNRLEPIAFRWVESLQAGFLLENLPGNVKKRKKLLKKAFLGDSLKSINEFKKGSGIYSSIYRFASSPKIQCELASRTAGIPRGTKFVISEVESIEGGERLGSVTMFQWNRAAAGFVAKPSDDKPQLGSEVLVSSALLTDMPPGVQECHVKAPHPLAGGDPLLVKKQGLVAARGRTGSRSAMFRIAVSDDSLFQGAEIVKLEAKGQPGRCDLLVNGSVHTINFTQADAVSTHRN